MDLASIWPVLTERLALRPLTVADAEDMAAYRSRPDVCRYVPFEPMSVDEAVARHAEAWTRTRIELDGDGIQVGIARRDGGCVIGDLSLFDFNAEHRGAELGWVLHPEYGGQGYATEAVRAMLGIAFGVIGLHRVVARVDARNVPSLALARRVGMRQEGHLVANEFFKGQWTDEIDFALLQDEWADQHATRS